MVYGKPFLISDLYFNKAVQQVLSHIINVGQVQKVLQNTVITFYIALLKLN